MGRASPSLPPKKDPRASTLQFPPTSPLEPEVTAEELATAPLALLYGLKNAAATYASFVSTSMSAYADLPGHHLRSTLDLIATPPASSYPEEVSSDEGAWAGANFFGLGDMETFLRFLEASNYCLSYLDSEGMTTIRDENASTSRSMEQPRPIRAAQGLLIDRMRLPLPKRPQRVVVRRGRPRLPEQELNDLTSNSSMS